MTQKSLVKAGKTDSEAKAFLARFAGRSRELPDSLKNDFGITDIGLICDTRKVSYVEFCNYIIEDVIIATPSDDDVIITEVVGMNILEKFKLGINTVSKTICLSEYSGAPSRIHPDFLCGTVRLNNR